MVLPHDPRLQALEREAGITRAVLHNCIPLWLHGDGVEYVDGRSLQVFSFGSVLNSGPSLDSSLLLCAYPKDVCTKETWDHVWAHVLPGFLQLQAGSRAGETIAGNYRFLLWNLIGDQEYYCNTLQMPHWSKAFSCWECKQSKEVQMSSLESPVPQNEMRSLAEELNCRISPHPFFTLPGLTHFNICQDAMHILFCKGVLSHCMGNALKHWCWHSNAVAGGTPKAKLATIWQNIQQLYKDFGVEHRLGILKLSMFVDADRPHQSQPFFKSKAAECKGLVSIFPALALKFNSGTTFDSKVIDMFEAMDKFVTLMDAAGRHPTEEESTNALDFCLQFLDSYKWLQLNRMNPFMWHTVGKFHMAKHMAMSFKFGNPRFSWCFQSEDFVGRLAKLSHSAAFGVAATHLSVKITEKYKLMMFIRMWKES
eukprot:Skav222160  [mRNA]  locus=scaffold3048:43996:45267:- [translate_table: standard]